jgi:hypothetical protein
MKNRDKYTADQILMARIGMGWYSQLRWYRLMADLGHEWAPPVVAKIEELHKDSMQKLNDFLDKEAV